MLIQNPNIIFIHIGKTAGTSIENCIKNKYKCYNHSAIEQHSSIIDYQQIVNLDNYFKFVVVRNPYTRLWSQYNFQLIKGLHKKRSCDGKLIRKKHIFYTDFAENYKPTISKFKKWIQYCYNIFVKYKKVYGEKVYTHNFWETIDLDYLTEKCAWCLILFRNQSNMIYDKNGKLLVDRILKFETLNKDWKYIKDKYQFNDLKKINTTKKINKKYTSYIELDVETKKMIYEILKTDFINFNYSSIGYNDI